MEMKRVYSSHVDSVGYDPEAAELHVTFQGKGGKPGKTAVYYGVPADVGNTVYNAPSVGSALASMVKDRYRHEYK